MNMKEIDDIFIRVEEIDELELINKKAIAENIVENFEDDDEIYQSDIIYSIQREFDDLINQIFDNAKDEIKNNGTTIIEK